MFRRSAIVLTLLLASLVGWVESSEPTSSSWWVSKTPPTLQTSKPTLRKSTDVPPVPKDEAIPEDPGSPEALAKTLRGLIMESLPEVLYEKADGWGKQKLVTRGLEWKGEGIVPKKQKSYKNHGVWRKIRVMPVAPTQTLDLRISHVHAHGTERKTFTTHLAMDIRVDAEQQNWRSGIRMFSGSFKARARVIVTLQCEATIKAEKTGGVLPDLVLRFRVLKSDVRYDHFVTEHVAGVGGEMAEWLGDAGMKLFQSVKPDIERKLLDKASASLTKAADTKEVRLSFGKLFSK